MDNQKRDHRNQTCEYEMVLDNQNTMQSQHRLTISIKKILDLVQNIKSDMSDSRLSDRDSNCVINLHRSPSFCRAHSWAAGCEPSSLAGVSLGGPGRSSSCQCHLAKDKAPLTETCNTLSGSSSHMTLTTVCYSAAKTDIRGMKTTVILEPPFQMTPLNNKRVHL